MIGRAIILVDGKRPFTTNVFLPFLCRPEECKDPDGKKRSPLILANIDQYGCFRTAVVATIDPDGIAQVGLPRKWFEPVWGVQDKKLADEMVQSYLHFDEKGRCVVANGKYFKVRP